MQEPVKFRPKPRRPEIVEFPQTIPIILSQPELAFASHPHPVGNGATEPTVVAFHPLLR